MSFWPTVPGIALMVVCLTAGGVIRDFATDIYYGKPRPMNLDIFTKALLHRDLEVYEERKKGSSECSEPRCGPVPNAALYCSTLGHAGRAAACAMLAGLSAPAGKPIILVQLQPMVSCMITAYQRLESAEQLMMSSPSVDAHNATAAAAAGS
jgi:hypothetical protein